MSAITNDKDQGTSGPAAIGGGRVATEGLDVSHGPILYLEFRRIQGAEQPHADGGGG